MKVRHFLWSVVLLVCQVDLNVVAFTSASNHHHVRKNIPIIGSKVILNGIDKKRDVVWKNKSVFGKIRSVDPNSNDACHDALTVSTRSSTRRSMGCATLGRRGAMKRGASAIAVMETIVGIVMGKCDMAVAVEGSSSSSMVSGEDVAKRMKRVPVFAIVDGTGVPFATYDKGSGSTATGYFFTTYAAAQYVLEDARKAYQDAKAAGKDTVDSWGESRIVTVSLASAMQLSVKKQSNVAQNGNRITTYYQTLPGASELTLAQKLENNKSSARFSERGRVPLFYFPQLTKDDTMLPMYFDPRDLLAEWKKQYPDLDPPPVKVRELTEVFYAMLKPGGDDESVKNMIFIPTPASLEATKDLQNVNSSDGIKYKMGEVVLTG